MLLVSESWVVIYRLGVDIGPLPVHGSLIPWKFHLAGSHLVAELPLLVPQSLP